MRARLTRLAAAAVPLLLLALAPLCHAEERTLNPYANQPYGGCEAGFCASVDLDLEYEFYQAASEGNTTLMKQLMDNPALNTSRNIVPDGTGFSRVLDVGLWAATRNGHVEAAEVGCRQGSRTLSKACTLHPACSKLQVPLLGASVGAAAAAMCRHASSRQMQ
jgi:hypothetical protein